MDEHDSSTQNEDCWHSTYWNFCKWHKAPFQIVWVGPGDEAILPGTIFCLTKFLFLRVLVTGAWLVWTQHSACNHSVYTVSTQWFHTLLGSLKMLSVYFLLVQLGLRHWVFIHLDYLVIFNHFQDHKQEIKLERPYSMIFQWHTVGLVLIARIW